MKKLHRCFDSEISEQINSAYCSLLPPKYPSKSNHGPHELSSNVFIIRSLGQTSLIPLCSWEWFWALRFRCSTHGSCHCLTRYPHSSRFIFHRLKEARLQSCAVLVHLDAMVFTVKHLEVKSGMHFTYRVWSGINWDVGCRKGISWLRCLKIFNVNLYFKEKTIQWLFWNFSFSAL